MTIESLFPFVKEIDRLKSVNRMTILHNGGRRENSAEHSWHLALSVMVFHHLAEEPIDVFRAVKMALVHDLVEIDAGDTFLYADQTGKAEKEAAAIERLVGLLPEAARGDLKQIWHEFEEKACPESRFVSALDRFLPLYSNYLNGGAAWRENGITADRIRGKNRPVIEAALPELWKAANAMVNERLADGSIQAQR